MLKKEEYEKVMLDLKAREELGKKLIGKKEAEEKK